MALSISPDLSTMRLAAGEPIVFSYQPASAAGVPEDLTGRAYVFALRDAQRNEVGYFDGQNRTDDIGPDVLWAIDGRTSAALYGQSLKWEISERLDNGKDVVATGTLTIDESAPRIDDYNSASIARYICRVKRSNDPATIARPSFTITMVAFSTATVAATPAPAFTTQPSISPTSGTVGTTFTASDGVASNTATYTRRWLLDGVSIGTAQTVTPSATGSLVLEVTANGLGGSKVAQSAAVAVAVAPAAGTGPITFDKVVQRSGNTYTITARRTQNLANSETRSWQLAGSTSYLPAARAADFAGTFPSGSMTFGANAPTTTITVTVPVTVQPE